MGNGRKGRKAPSGKTEVLGRVEAYYDQAYRHARILIGRWNVGWECYGHPPPYPSEI